MVARIRYFVLGIVVALVLATIAHATTWVFWVGAPNANSPSNGTSATWGNYWNGAVIFYSNQNFYWQVPFFNDLFYIHTPGNVYWNPFSSSGYATWVALSNAYTLNNYVYQGVVGAYSNVAIGGNYTFSSGYQYFMVLAYIVPSSEVCGQLYFHADVYNNSTSTAMFYGVYILANLTWSYVTFFSDTASSNSWFNPAVPGPNTCLSVNSVGYYYIALVAVNTTEYTVGTAQVSIGTTSEGTSYVPGTQYSTNQPPSAGSVVVVPWTSYANPHFLFFVETVVNTGGSNVGGDFYITSSTSWSYDSESAYSIAVPFYGNYQGATSVNYIIYAYDNDTGYFPSAVITATGCPSGVYMMSASVSSSVTKILSCSGISSPTSGIAIYPTDYGKYSSSPVSYSPPVGYMVTFSYTDSAGNTYSLPDYFTVSTTVYLYMPVGTYTISTRQVSFPLQTNFTLFSLQPTNNAPVITQFNAGFNTAGYPLQFPLCQITSNPYISGATGTYGLLQCVSVEYGALSIVVWFYEPNGGSGILIGTNNQPYTSRANYYQRDIWIDTSGVLHGLNIATSSAINPGWHMVVLENWYSGGSYYDALYLDGQLIGTSSGASSLFGAGNQLYNYISTSWYPGYGWFFFNGTIAYVAIYNTILNSTQVQQLYQAGFPNTLFSNNLVVAYLLTNTTYYVYDGVSHFYIKPYYANPVILNQLGIFNASLITITPTGQVGWVPFSQWVPVPSQPISFCRLLRVYGLNTVSENSTAVTYQVVVGTKASMNNFPLDYPLLLKYIYYAGVATQTILVPVFVHAFGYGNIYTATISMKKPPSTMSTSPPVATISFPMCNLPPGFVSLNQSIITTNVSSLIHLLVTFSVSVPPSVPTAFPGVVYLNNTPYYTFNIIMPPGANGTTSLVKFPIKFNAPNEPGTYIGNVTVFGLSTPIELIVEGPPSVNTTNSTSPPSPGTNSTSNTPPPPPPNTGSSSSSSSSSTSSSSASSSTTTASTILTKLSASLADALTTVRTNPVVIALLVLAVVAIAYIIYKRLTEVVIKL